MSYSHTPPRGQITIYMSSFCQNDCWVIAFCPPHLKGLQKKHTLRNLWPAAAVIKTTHIGKVFNKDIILKIELLKEIQDHSFLPGGLIPAALRRALYLETQFWCCTSPRNPTTFTHSGLSFTTSPVVVVHSFPRPPTYRWSSFTASHSALKPFRERQIH